MASYYDPNGGRATADEWIDWLQLLNAAMGSLCVCGNEGTQSYLGERWCGAMECGVILQEGLDHNEEVGNR